MMLSQFNKIKGIIGFFAFICVLNLFSAFTAFAQDIEARIKMISSTPAHSRLRVEGKILNLKDDSASRNLSFLQNYADVSELDKRIENLNLFNENGEKIEFKKLTAGEFQSEKPFVSFAYDVKTDAPTTAASAAHVSWVTDDFGLLMLDDLLPQWRNGKAISAKIIVETPNGWKLASSETAGGKNVFSVENIEKTIFFIGKNLREKSVRIDKTELNLAIAGEWQFSDDEALEMADSILKEYRKIFGAIPVQKTQILVFPFPGEKNNQHERWRAETRGSTVTIVSGAVTLKSQALQRLHEQLRHEILHLWIPNALNLSGNYDWFFEGFAVYQALKTGVELNQIRFEDYLNTLASAYRLAQTQNASLLEISNNRWAGAGVGGGSVYSKGMVAAFLCDAALLRESGGRRSLTNVFRRIFEKHGAANKEQNANAAILAVLKSYPELRPIVQNYIEGTAKIEWREELNAFGIESVKSDSGIKLKVATDLKKRQKDLLDKLGYNQWRKLVQRKK